MEKEKSDAGGDLKSTKEEEELRKNRTQDDFRNLIRNPLLGDLPPVTPKLQSDKTLAGEDDAPEDLKPCRNPNNPICFFDIEIGGKPGSNETGQSVGRIYFELHAHIVPKTCENFQKICDGVDSRLRPGAKLHYKDSPMHRVVPGFMCQGGDFTNGDGSGGESVFGARFPDENFRTRHTKEGLLSMANKGPNTNSSQFFLTTAATPHLDGRHVVFGEVIWGSAIVKKIDAVGTEDGVPTEKVVVKDCGTYATAEQRAKQLAAKRTSSGDGGEAGKPKAAKRAKVDVKGALAKLTVYVQDEKRLPKACKLVIKLLETELRSDNNVHFFALFTAIMQDNRLAMKDTCRMHIYNLFKEVQQRREFFDEAQLRQIDVWWFKLETQYMYRK